MTKNNNIGTGTPGSRLKSGHKHGSFREYVQEQLNAGNPDAKAWIANKSGKNSTKRTPQNEQRIQAEKFAKKNQMAKKK